MKNFARIGCLARSFVYFSVGVLALLVAMGSSYGATTDESGVLRRILEQPFGYALLFALAVGLFSYAVWRTLQSIQDHDNYGRTWSGLGVRAGFLLSGAAHFFLGCYALNLIFGLTKNTRLGERMMARWMLLQPFGRFFLAVAGISVIVTGFIQFLRASNGSFARDLIFPPARAFWIRMLCSFGLFARGIVFVIIGSFLVLAAWKERSREAGGLPKAWETLRLQPAGDWLLGMVAIGFIAFAIFSLIEGFYRRRIV